MEKNSKYNLLIVTWEMEPVYAGGLGFMVKSFVDELTAQGHRCTVLLPHALPSPIEHCVSLEKETKKFLKKKEIIPNFDFNLDLFRQTADSKTNTTWPHLFTGNKSENKVEKPNLYPNNTPILTKAFAFAVYEYLQNNPEYDFIIGTDWLSIPSFALLKEKQVATPFFFYVHSTEYQRNLTDVTANKTTKAISKLEFDYFKKGDAVLCVSEKTLEQMLERFEVPAENGYVLNDDIEFEPSDVGIKNIQDGKYVSFIGRFVTQKGLFFLLDTAQRVIEIDPTIKFILSGDGESLPEVVEGVVERGLERNCIFTGWINNIEKKKIYRSSSVFVMPSPSEPFGITALEAIRSDNIVLASDSCGFLGVVPSTPTFKYHDTESFSRLLLYYLENDDARNTLLKQQQKELSKHNWRTEIQNFINFLKQYEARN